MAMSIELQYFAPGLDPAGVSAVARFSGHSLVIEAAGAEVHRVAVAQLQLSRGGFDGRQRLLHWTSNGEAHALRLPESAASQAWLAGAPDALKTALQADAVRQGRSRRRFGIGLAAIASVFLAPFFLLLVFWLNADRVAGWLAEHVSLEHEQQLGELAFTQMRGDLNLLESGPGLALVQTLGQRLTEGSHYTYRWYVADRPEINAFAIPGGIVVVHTGLLQAAESVEEVAGVLAHEVSHVEQRHALRNMLHQLGWRAMLSLALGDVGGTVWADLGAELGSLKYSRDLERAADAGGLDTLKQAGIAPQGLARFFERLAAQDGESIALLSTHPASQDRQAALAQAIAEAGDYPLRPLGLRWPPAQD